MRLLLCQQPHQPLTSIRNRTQARHVLAISRIEHSLGFSDFAAHYLEVHICPIRRRFRFSLPLISHVGAGKQFIWILTRVGHWRARTARSLSGDALSCTCPLGERRQLEPDLLRLVGLRLHRSKLRLNALLCRCCLFKRCGCSIDLARKIRRRCCRLFQCGAKSDNFITGDAQACVAKC